MTVEKLEFLSAVLLVSRDVERLAAFYRDVLRVPLETERHDETEAHYGCTLGDLHFAIHPVSDFPEAPEAGVGAMKLAFTVFDLEGFVAHLRARGVTPLYPPKDLGWCQMTAVKDPDGNLVELTQLDAAWFEGLAARRAQGQDVVQRFRAQRTR